MKTALQSLAAVDEIALRAYLQKRKAVRATGLVPELNADGPIKQQNIRKPPAITTAWNLSPENLGSLNVFIERLKLKAYSPSTLTAYRNEFLQLLQLLKKKRVDDLTPEDLRPYFVYCFEKLNLSENSLHSRINAVKFYFEQVLGREKFFWEIPRPKKAEKLPNVLGENEVIRLFRALDNLKHEAILFTAYSAGLRVSEVVGLRLKDIDSERMQIRVVAGRGKKGGYVA